MQKNWTQLMASMLHIWSIGHPKFSYWGYLAQPHHVSKDWVLFAQFVFQTKFNYSSHWHATAVLIYMYFFLSTHRTNFFRDPNYLSKPLLTSTLFTGEICRNKCTYFRRPTKRSAHFCCATGKEKNIQFSEAWTLRWTHHRRFHEKKRKDYMPMKSGIWCALGGCCSKEVKTFKRSPVLTRLRNDF